MKAIATLAVVIWCLSGLAQSMCPGLSIGGALGTYQFTDKFYDFRFPNQTPLNTWETSISTQVCSDIKASILFNQSWDISGREDNSFFRSLGAGLQYTPHSLLQYRVTPVVGLLANYSRYENTNYVFKGFSSGLELGARVQLIKDLSASVMLQTALPVYSERNGFESQSDVFLNSVKIGLSYTICNGSTCKKGESKPCCKKGEAKSCKKDEAKACCKKGEAKSCKKDEAKACCKKGEEKACCKKDEAKACCKSKHKKACCKKKDAKACSGHHDISDIQDSVAPGAEYYVEEVYVMEDEPMVEEVEIEEPMVQELQIIQPEKVKIYFDLGKSALVEDHKMQLEDIADFLTSNPEFQVGITGYADGTGSEPANESLSAKRAEAVRKFLIGSGVSDGRIFKRAFGDSKASGSEQNREDRRVEIEVL